ncbi:MAG: hypothetical protein AAF660_04775, partial [Pseudomonadota bacterium]
RNISARVCGILKGVRPAFCGAAWACSVIGVLAVETTSVKRPLYASGRAEINRTTRRAAACDRLSVREIADAAFFSDQSVRFRMLARPVVDTA